MTKQLFLFYGDEDYLIEKKIDQHKKKIGDQTIGLEQIDCSKPNFEQLVSALHASPLLGGDKLLILRDVDLMAQLWLELIPYLKNISPQTQVIFWTKSVDKRGKFYKFLAKEAELFEFRSFAPWEEEQAICFIIKEFKDQALEINYQAAVSLQQICGNNLRKLSSEIEKIITYVGSRKTINEIDVKVLASPGLLSSFALSEAIADKDLIKALQTFRILLVDKVDYFLMLSLLATQYRTMLQIKSVSAAASNARSLAQTLGANPYFVKKCLDKSHRFKNDELKNNLELLLTADLKLKSGADQATTFELLIAQLCAKAKVAIGGR